MGFKEQKYAKVGSGQELGEAGGYWEKPPAAPDSPASSPICRWSCVASSTSATGRPTSRRPHAQTLVVSPACFAVLLSCAALHSHTASCSCGCFRPLAACPHHATLPPSPLFGAVCCVSAFCSCCVSYHLRKRVLRGDMTRYIW